MGSYVPADRVVMSVLDSVFTRMGASDNLAQGRSTFLEVPPPAPLPACSTRAALAPPAAAPGRSFA